MKAAAEHREAPAKPPRGSRNRPRHDTPGPRTRATPGAGPSTPGQKSVERRGDSTPAISGFWDILWQRRATVCRQARGRTRYGHGPRHIFAPPPSCHPPCSLTRLGMVRTLIPDASIQVRGGVAPLRDEARCLLARRRASDRCEPALPGAGAQALCQRQSRCAGLRFFERRERRALVLPVALTHAPKLEPRPERRARTPQEAVHVAPPPVAAGSWYIERPI